MSGLDQIKDKLSRIETILADMQASFHRVEMTPAPKSLTVSAFAKRIGKTPRTVQRMIAAGKIKKDRHGLCLVE